MCKFDINRINQVKPKELRALATVAENMFHVFDANGRTDIGFSHDRLVLIRNEVREEIRYKDLENISDEELEEIINVFYDRANNCYLKIVK